MTTVIRLLCVTVVVLSVGPVQAQQRATVEAQEHATLRAMLTRAGFGDGATGVGAPDLERALTSSESGTSATSFVAAYYFADESPNQVLGPLHVSRFDRLTRRWIHAMPFDSDIGGSVLGVAVSARYVILDLHWNPSAGQGVVLDSSTLALVGTFQGFGERELPDGVIVHSGNAVHFAPTHKYRLFAFEPRSKRSTEIFPGRRESTIAAEYRRNVRAAYAQLPQDSREQFERSVYGAVDDFDRDFESVTEGANGKAIAFIVSYSCTRLDNLPPTLTVVRCQHQSETWTCSESSVEQASRTTRVTVWRGGNGLYDKGVVERMLRVLVER